MEVFWWSGIKKTCKVKGRGTIKFFIHMYNISSFNVQKWIRFVDIWLILKKTMAHMTLSTLPILKWFFKTSQYLNQITLGDKNISWNLTELYYQTLGMTLIKWVPTSNWFCIHRIYLSNHQHTIDILENPTVLSYGIFFFSYLYISTRWLN